MMHNKITTKIRAAFAGKLKDVCKNFTYTETHSIVDQRTDKETVTTATYTGYGAFLRPNSEETNDLILSTDTKILVIQEDINWSPKIGQMIDGKRIFSIGEDPTHSLWKIFARYHNALE